MRGYNSIAGGKGNIEDQIFKGIPNRRHPLSPLSDVRQRKGHYSRAKSFESPPCGPSEDTDVGRDYNMCQKSGFAVQIDPP